jgi:C-terminal processing protease CtpA/Prc
MIAALSLASAAQSQTDPVAESAATEAMRAKPITDEEFRLQLEPELEAKVDACIAQLSSPSYKVREDAAKGLLDVGAPVMSKLREAYRSTDDLETRLRVEEIARSAYLNYHVLDNHGFLGISMRAYDPAAFAQMQARLQQQIPQQQRPQQAPRITLPPGRVGLSVEQVIPNTGAARAGLERHDIVIGLNGNPLTGSGQEISNNFSSIIRGLRPGATVDLELVRGSDVLNIQAVLARPPEDVARDSRIIVVSSLYQVAEERFEQWWAQYFVQPSPDSQSSR